MAATQAIHPCQATLHRTSRGIHRTTRTARATHLCHQFIPGPHMDITQAMHNKARTSIKVYQVPVRKRMATCQWGFRVLVIQVCRCTHPHPTFPQMPLPHHLPHDHQVRCVSLLSGALSARLRKSLMSESVASSHLDVVHASSASLASKIIPFLSRMTTAQAIMLGR